MTFFRNLYRALDAMSDKWRSVYIIAYGLAALFVCYLISLFDIFWWLRLLIFIFLLIITVVIAHDIQQSLARRAKHKQKPQPKSPRIPPKPDRPPHEPSTDTAQLPQINKKGDNEQLIAVLGQLSYRLEKDAKIREQQAKEEEAKKRARERLLADETPYYDKSPSIFYFFEHGLWKILLALLLEAAALYLCLLLIQSTQDFRWLILAGISLLACAWYITRCCYSWVKLRRRIVGSWAYIEHPYSRLLLLHGGSDSVSLLDCGNATINKSLLQLIFGIDAATVRIDTSKENANSNREDVPTRADPFNNMKHVKKPKEYRDIIRTRHEELIFGQPDVMRRSDP